MTFAQEHISSLMNRMNLGALLFWSLENICYLCGFTGSDGALVVTPGEKIFLSDFRYEEQARVEVRGAAFQKYRKKVDGVARCLKSMKIRRVGFEASALSYESYARFKERLPRAVWVPLSAEISNLRARKEPEEIASIRRAVAVATKSFGDALVRVKPGTAEARVAEILEIRMRQRGAEGPGFPAIVASGPRGALPHAKPSEKKMENGELVVVDFGARVEGYHSDETKTLMLGKPDRRQKRIYDLVRKAQEKAIKRIRPGADVRRIDAAARETISRAGYGEYFGHGLGHGIGLAVHEPPTLSPRGSGRVEAGMVFSVEPGIYLPGWGGVRLEDLVVVTDRGCEFLTHLSKDLKDNIIEG